MANICSIDLHLTFRTPEHKHTFRTLFEKSVRDAEERGEGVKIARSKWLFDVDIEDEGERSLRILGWVKWGLEPIEMAEFTQFLQRHGVTELTCGYEETSGCVYGEYKLDEDGLWDSYIPDDHPVWQNAADPEDVYFEALDHALETEGELAQAA